MSKEIQGKEIGPVCSICNDTHRMELGDREVMCTHCPTPCEDCRGRPPGPYCETTPCPCACHLLDEHMTLLSAIAEVRQLRAEVARLEALIHTPRTDEFFAAVQLEAAHQAERWPAAHDAGKADTDWFWLIGYLAGKVLRGDEKRLHHIVTTAAAALNWWRHATGVSRAMRPGIAEPEARTP